MGSTTPFKLYRRNVTFLQARGSATKAEELAIKHSLEQPNIEVVLGYSEFIRVYLNGELIRQS